MFCSFQFNRLAISWPPWVRVWGWASCRFLPFTVFYIVHLRCTSEGGQSRCLTNRSFFLCVGQFVSVCGPAGVLQAEWIVSCTRITCIQPLSRCSQTFLASSFFSESVVVLFFSLFLFFSTMRSFFFFFFFISGLLAILYPLVSLNDQGSPFAFLFSSAFVYILMLCHRQS